MPPKKQKNIRACIPDVLDHPLHAIPAAIRALLPRTSPLDEVEAKAVFEEGSTILDKCIEAIEPFAIGSTRQPDADTFGVAEAMIGSCFRLLQIAFMASPDAGQAGLDFFVQTDRAFDKIKVIFDTVVFRHQVGESCQLDVLHVVDFLCEGAMTKEKAGEVFSDLLRVMMADRDVGFMVQREVATALINLVKCSKANKTRLGDLSEVVIALNHTVDFFLQLQCVELIFRCSRQNKGILDRLQLPSGLLHGLGALPNDGNLLKSMIRCLDDWNDSREVKLILKFDVSRVDVALDTVCSAASVYFSPTHFLIMMPDGVADNITVPYTMLRSVKVSKDGKIMLKLTEVPIKLDGRLQIGVEGHDFITIFVKPATLAAFKKSNIHAWIVTVLKQKGQHQVSPLQAVSDSKPEVGRTSGTKNVEPAAVEEKPKGMSKKKTPVRRPRTNDALQDAVEALGAHLAADEDQPVRVGSGSKKRRLEPEEGRDPSQTATALFSQKAVSEQRSAAPEVDDVLDQLRGMIEQNVMKKREEGHKILRSTMETVQAFVDESKASNEKHCEAVREALLAEYDSAQKAHEVVGKRVVEIVHNLNSQLQALKGGNQTIRDQISCLDIEYPQVTVAAKADEENFLKSLKQDVETQMTELQHKINQKVMDQASLRDITSYMSRKVQQESF